MACLYFESPQLFSKHQSYDDSFDQQFEDSISAEFLTEPDASTSYLSNNVNIPKPPPLPTASYRKTNISKRVTSCNCVLYETSHAWDRLFTEGYHADVHVLIDDKGIILAHSNILGISSSVLRSMLERSKVKEGFRCIKIHGVPSEAARAFVRFLYSSCYDPEDMKRFVLHLLVLSHSFAVASLKRACISELERSLLTTDNVVDVLQLARKCDAPRLSLMCIRLIIKDFKTISASEGWKVMKHTNPSLEQELLESLVEADSKLQEKGKRIEERKVYVQLYEAMEALLHISRDGCRTIEPRDKILNDSQRTCNYPACKVLESLLRHFLGCKAQVPGGCQHCKRMRQLLELHSRMCAEPDLCKVPLCRHFKDKMHPNKKEEAMWNTLVRKVMATKGTISSISAWRPLIA
ncbi:uncharacterized protein A4U43_C04F18730 [Asparagus officinalis]|uniref:BTB domain-containing protein n=1 Tax=Asparagus officinalis TaxID=4686 RepID=A0A5P1F2H1_ASPOF|nr:BTB/POZ and TAZ domain-containing protein 3 isoform X2 [Asparagus officinalis]ONK72372.1 uncharacterized protein A4U43_C04F18730 [Asparagus officinalis]